MGGWLRFRRRLIHLERSLETTIAQVHWFPSNFFAVMIGCPHYRDGKMGPMASLITDVSIVYLYWTVCLGADKKIKTPRHWPLRREPITSGFPSQRASNAENVSIWWRHHVNVYPPSRIIMTYRSILYSTTTVIDKNSILSWTWTTYKI